MFFSYHGSWIRRSWRQQPVIFNRAQTLPQCTQQDKWVPFYCTVQNYLLVNGVICSAQVILASRQPNCSAMHSAHPSYLPSVLLVALLTIPRLWASIKQTIQTKRLKETIACNSQILFANEILLYLQKIINYRNFPTSRIYIIRPVQLIINVNTYWFDGFCINVLFETQYNVLCYNDYLYASLLNENRSWTLSSACWVICCKHSKFLWLAGKVVSSALQITVNI